MSATAGESVSSKAANAAGMRSVGVTWGANSQEKLEADFDVVVTDVPALATALRGFLQ